MLIWIYCLLVTAYFLYFKDYLLFIRDDVYRNMVWNNASLINVDMESIDNYLKANYNLPARVISKVFFVFISPIYLLYVLYYVINRLDY